MAHLIDKSALVPEIESKKKYAQTMGDNAINGSMQQFYDGMKQGCVDILSFIDTLEVKKSLTWQDIRLISEIGEKFMNSEESDNLSEEEYYTEILNRFKAQKHETDII